MARVAPNRPRAAGRAGEPPLEPAPPANARAPALDPAAMLAFAAMARAGGVRGAAAALGVPKSTVSRRLAQLEALVGAPLVVRTARRFSLTEAGQALASRCDKLEALLAESEQAVRGVAGEPSGLLRVAAAPVLGEEVLPSILSDLVARHPRLAVDVRLSVDYDDLRRGGVDVALRARAPEDASDVFATRLGVSVTGCYVSPAYARSRGAPESPADLSRHACILVGAGRPTAWEFVRDGAPERVPVDGPVRVDSLRLARALAARGVGVFRTARMFAAPLVATGELVPVLEPYWPSTPIYAVHAGPNPPSPKVRAFVDLARRYVSPVL